MLLPYLNKELVEAGCDEAGRGCLAGPVYAAAVVLPHDYSNPLLNDSKKLSARQRYMLREEIERDATAWAVAYCDNQEIDHLNILRASFHAMNLAVSRLTIHPQFLLIDGNRFINESDLPYQCVVKGDGKYQAIAAASILAKTYRDDYMEEQHQKYPHYGWDSNKGYPTSQHYRAILDHGITPLHRKSFTLYQQQELKFS